MGRPKVPIDRSILEQLYRDEKRSPSAIAKLLGCNRQTILNRLHEYGIPMRSPGESTALAKITYPRAPYCGDPREKAYLIGLRLGDLTVDQISPSGQTIRVSCASTRPEQIELIRDLFEPYGGIVLNGPYAHGRIFIQCLLDGSFRFLLEKEDCIPGWILENEATFLSFLGGYADAEAYIGVSNGKASVRIATGDKNILFQIHAMLTGMGIECLPPRLWLAKGYQNKRGVTTHIDMWRLGIYRMKSVQDLLVRLLPYLRHAKRKNDAQRVLGYLELGSF